MSNNNLVYDDTYTGPRWRYALINRPMAGCHVPKGWIIWSDKKHPDYNFGTVEYPFELPADQVAAFELKYLGPV